MLLGEQLLHPEEIEEESAFIKDQGSMVIKLSWYANMGNDKKIFHLLLMTTI